jgi:hypothetical protein
VGQTADGRLWFPTAKGLAVIDPADVTTNAVKPPVVIEELRVEDQPQNLAPLHHRGQADQNDSAPLQIPPGNQQFEIRYTGLSFAAPDKVRFVCKLEGLDHEWKDQETRRLAQYSYLRPGAYRFRVKACNNDGVWNETGASVSFTVLPHFWQTWWFGISSLIGGAAAVAATGMTFTRRRVLRKLEQLERQRALERIEDARIALDVRTLVIPGHPLPRQRREIVDALVVVRPQVVARRRVEKPVESQFADDR